MTYPEFLEAYQDGSLENDAGWRAYDIPAVAARSTSRTQGLLRKGLKQAGFDSRHPALGICAIASQYGLATPGMARDTLIMWQILVNLQNGLRMVGLPVREYNYNGH